MSRPTRVGIMDNYKDSLIRWSLVELAAELDIKVLKDTIPDIHYKGEEHSMGPSISSTQSISIASFSTACESQKLPAPKFSRDGAVITEDLYSHYSGYASMLQDWLSTKSIDKSQHDFLKAWYILHARRMGDIDKQIRNNQEPSWRDIYFYY